MVIESAESAVEYARLSVHSHRPVNATIEFDVTHEHLYVASLTKVTA